MPAVRTGRSAAPEAALRYGSPRPPACAVSELSLALCESPARPGDAPVPEGLDDKVVEVYRGVGQLLSRYTTGKVRARAWAARVGGRWRTGWCVMQALLGWDGAKGKEVATG
jgi:hypothetical protein